jgi:hypothetical protein
MTIKRTLTVLTAMLTAALTAASLAAAAPGSASILIRHQTRGCHTWAVNGGAFKTNQTLSLARNGTVTIVNNDLMPHTLVQLSGPKPRVKALPTATGMMGLKGTFGPATMAHMGAAMRVTFPAAGTYVFKTRFGEDYPMAMSMETVGEDNVLRLVVHVA